MEIVKEVIFDIEIIETERRVRAERVEWETEGVDQVMGEEDKGEEKENGVGDGELVEK